MQQRCQMALGTKTACTRLGFRISRPRSTSTTSLSMSPARPSSLPMAEAVRLTACFPRLGKPSKARLTVQSPLRSNVREILPAEVWLWGTRYAISSGHHCLASPEDFSCGQSRRLLPNQSCPFVRQSFRSGKEDRPFVLKPVDPTKSISLPDASKDKGSDARERKSTDANCSGSALRKVAARSWSSEWPSYKL